jgi:hypothetical protein
MTLLVYKVMIRFIKVKAWLRFSALAVLALLTGFTKTSIQNEKPGYFPCGKCDYIVSGYNFDGQKLDIHEGQIICFDALMHYKTIKLSHIKGKKFKPVIIRNCGGPAVISEGLRVENSEHFQLIGDGDPDTKYGLKVQTHKSFFITFEMFTTDFEVSRVEVAGYNENGLGEGAGFAGMGIKTSPYQACELFGDSTRQAWVMRNVNVHDNYIHDTGGEGMYIGHGFYSGRKEQKCPNKTWSHSIKGLKVHHNLVEDTGWDGIQVKNADDSCEVYNNVIRNYGTRNNRAQNEGLMLADGVTGKAYNNLIDTGTGHGIMFQGMGNNDIFNNIVLNAGEDGFNGTGSVMGLYLPNGYYRIFNNTIYNSKNNGFTFFNGKGGEKLIMNNLVVKAGAKLYPKGARAVLANNIFSQDSSILDFAKHDPLTLDTSLFRNVRLRIFPASVDKGADVRLFLPSLNFDFYNARRPKGKAFDIGAIEFE